MVVMNDSSWSYTPQTTTHQPMGNQHPKMDLKPARYPSKTASDNGPACQWFVMVCVPRFVHITLKVYKIAAVFGVIFSSTNPFWGTPIRTFWDGTKPPIMHLISHNMFPFIPTVNPPLMGYNCFFYSVLPSPFGGKYLDIFNTTATLPPRTPTT